MSRALWYIASPRNLKPFYDWADKVDFVDKLIVKNHMHHDAQKIAMDFFFKKDYDYFIISSDDVLGKPSYVKLLIEDEEKHGFPVISGWMHFRGLTNVTMEPVKNIETPGKVRIGSYNFISSEEIVNGRDVDPFFNVWFVGLPLTLIRRDTLKTVPLKPFLLQRDAYCITPETKKKGRGKMFDLQFAINCEARNIPITIDSRICLNELKGTNLQVGKKAPKINFLKARNPV